jgi:hypothetical protein
MQLVNEINAQSAPNQIQALASPSVIITDRLNFEQTMALAHNAQIINVEYAISQHPNLISALGALKSNLNALKFNYVPIQDVELQALLTFTNSMSIHFGQLESAPLQGNLPSRITQLNFDVLTPQLASALPRSVSTISYQRFLPGALSALPESVSMINFNRVPSAQELYQILHADTFVQNAILNQETEEQRNAYWMASSSQGCLKSVRNAIACRSFHAAVAQLTRAREIDPHNPNIALAEQMFMQAQHTARVSQHSPTNEEHLEGAGAFFISYGDIYSGTAARTVIPKRSAEPEVQTTVQIPRTGP